jgi:hypothetical protein
MTVKENAKIDDGCLNLYGLEFDRLWKLALIYPAFCSGRHGIWKEVRTISCAAVEICTRRPQPVNTDGEITTETPARFRVLPQAAAVLAPVSPPGEERAMRVSGNTSALEKAQGCRWRQRRILRPPGVYWTNTVLMFTNSLIP